MNKRLEAQVSGIVQGVMFRDFVKRSADKLGVFGFTCNQSDGSVLVVAEGEEEKLESLVSKLWRGPFLTRIRMRVDNVETSFTESKNEFKEFIIDRG